MSNHAYALVPIESWCYSSPDVVFHGGSIDIGLMAESLIYYDTIYLHVTNQPQLATLIEWFVKQGKLTEVLKCKRTAASYFLGTKSHGKGGDYF